MIVFEGVIDSNYVGSIKIRVENTNEEGEIHFNIRDRITQILFLPVSILLLIKIEELPETNQGIDRCNGCYQMCYSGIRLDSSHIENSP